MTTLVLGLEGGCFELIQPWIDDRTLPTFSKLIDDGVASDMRSCLPPVTCPNWKCYATGTDPGKPGVFWWEAVDRDTRTIENRSSAIDLDGTHYCRLLECNTAVVNLPTSYAPSKIDGIHIAGGPGAEQTGYTHPESLEKGLKERHNYAVHPEKMSLLSGDDPDNDCILEISDLTDTRFDVLEDQLESGENALVHVTVFYLNVLQHFYWEMDVVKRAWERIDERVEQLLEIEKLEHLFVISDHGSNGIETTSSINTWHEQHGYLQTESSISDFLHRAGITQECVRPTLAELGVEWWVRRLLSERVQMLLPDKEGSVDRSEKSDVIDWENLQVVASGQGPMYVSVDHPQKRERIAEELANDLEGITDPDGNPVFDQVLRGEDVYSGLYADRGPDIVLDQAAGVHIEGKIGHDDTFGSPIKWHGENEDTGMFIAHGPEIDGTGSVMNMHILDIAPTLLHLHGEGVPEQMDGEVKWNLFAAESEPMNREVIQVDATDLDDAGSPAVETDATDRLEDLGYME